MLKSVQVFWADRAKMPLRAFKSSLLEDRWVLAIFFPLPGIVTRHKFTDRKKYQSNR